MWDVSEMYVYGQSAMDIRYNAVLSAENTELAFCTNMNIEQSIMSNSINIKIHRPNNEKGDASD